MHPIVTVPAERRTVLDGEAQGRMQCPRSDVMRSQLRATTRADVASLTGVLVSMEHATPPLTDFGLKRLAGSYVERHAALPAGVLGTLDAIAVPGIGAICTAHRRRSAGPRTVPARRSIDRIHSMTRGYFEGLMTVLAGERHG